MKRALDLVVAASASLVLFPVIAVVLLATYLMDRGSPIYTSQRVGKGGRLFGMLKVRTMVIKADETGVHSTADDDPRITALGRILRRFKLDETPQLYNILRGDMSFVGPRPNVPSEVALYSDIERQLLSVRPGVTDFSSIVFADEADILHGSAHPDRDYNLLIRPGKSRLGLHYVRNRSLVLDLRLMCLTLIAAGAPEWTRTSVVRTLRRTGADEELVGIARRDQPLVASLPPGVTEDAWERHL